jgi:hypothetical protein
LLTGDVERDIGGEFYRARNGGVHRLYGEREDHSPQSPGIKYNTKKRRVKSKEYRNGRTDVSSVYIKSCRGKGLGLFIAWGQGLQVRWFSLGGGGGLPGGAGGGGVGGGSRVGELITG